MTVNVNPRLLSGQINVIPSKSVAHRYLICAALSQQETELICPQTNQDIEATAACLNALDAQICRTENGYHVTPIGKAPEKATLFCGESGSTLRFMLPIVGALGVDATFVLEGRLPQRPLSPLWEEMERMGCTAEEHDKLIAFTSQMPHVLSNAFIKSPTAGSHKGFSAGSYKDLTRVAWLNPQMWAQLCMENRENMLSELETYINNLKAYQTALEQQDMDELVHLLDEGRRRKEEVDG